MIAQDLARLFLRVVVGCLLFFHGLAKLRAGLGPIVPMVTAHGFPAIVAYGVYIGELIAPLLVALGLFTRVAAGVIVLNMAVAIWLAHAGDLLKLSKGGGHLLELPLLYLVGALTLVLLGGGRYALRPD